MKIEARRNRGLVIILRIKILRKLRFFACFFAFQNSFHEFPFPVDMALIESWLSTILEASGVPLSIVAEITARGSSSLEAVLGNLDQNGPCGSDPSGFLSVSGISNRRRKVYTNTLPRINVDGDHDRLLSWLKAFTSSRYRPLRSAATIASMHLVEDLLKRLVVNDVSPNESKQILVFCGKVSSHICLVRSRDTFPVIRQIVAEYICRWCEVRREVLTSSVFSRGGALLECVGDLVIDDEPEVRKEMLRGLTDVFSRSKPSMIPHDFVRLVVRSFLVRCNDYRAQQATGFELRSHAELLLTLAAVSTEALDSVNEFENVYQTLWDRRIPVVARCVVSKLVSRHVFGKDIFADNFCDFKRGGEMILAFIDQFRPDIDDSYPVIESFLFELDQASLQGYLCSTRDGKFLYAISAIAIQNGYFGLTIDDPLLIAAAEGDVNVLSSLINFIKVGAILSSSVIETIRLLIPKIVKAESSSYLERYLGFKLWSALSQLDIQLGQSLELLDIETTSPNDLLTLHALESVVKRPPIDETGIDRLFDFIEHGQVNSVSTLVCAIDLLFIQTLKHGQYSDLVTEKLLQMMRRIREETRKDSGKDSVVIDFYCRYKLGGLEQVQLKPRKGYVDLKAGEGCLEGLSTSSLILAGVLGSGSVFEELVPLIE